MLFFTPLFLALTFWSNFAKNGFPWAAFATVVGAIITAIAAIGGPILLWRMQQAKKNEEIKPSAMQEALMGSSEIYAFLHRWSDLLRAPRILLLKTSNGGGVPRAGHPLYSSVCCESANPPLAPQSPQWDKQKLDEPYRKMLLQLLTEEYIPLITEKMKPGKLRDVYESQGVVQSEVMLLRLTDNHMYYVSINHVEEADLDTAERRNLRRVLSNELNQLLAKLKFFV